MKVLRSENRDDAIRQQPDQHPAAPSSSVDPENAGRNDATAARTHRNRLNASPPT